jgi:sec-independent protein translocase protein TatA
MRLGPLGLPEILIILAILLLIFGARRLPEISSSLGRSIRSFKSSVTGEDDLAQSPSQEKPPVSSTRNTDDLA